MIGPKLPSNVSSARQRDDASVTTLLEEAQQAEREGKREIARRRLEGALYLGRDALAAADATLIMRRIGRLYLDDGDVLAGLDCAEAALAVAKAFGDKSAIANALNVKAIGYWQRGLLDEADELYREARDLARAAGDATLIAMVDQNLGVIANMRGKVTLALRHYYASLTRFRTLGLDRNVANLLNNIGMAYAQLGGWDDAERTFQDALALCEKTGDVSVALMIEVNRADLRLSRGDYAGAELVCERVLQQARPLSDRRVLAETYKHCGVIAREVGRPEEADMFLRAAFDNAMAQENLLLAAEAAREQAELYTMIYRNREALQALNTSHRLFSQLRAQRNLADVRGRILRLERRFLDLVRQWGQSIESKDRYTHGHCARVAEYACALARELGFDEPTLFWFRVGALLHDVGKIVVPSDILNKNARLTTEERQIIERHAAAGADLLKDIDFPWDVLPMVRHHHERWDGAGYPSRLSGQEIPLSARILCVADVYDALTTHRPYRPARSVDDAIAIMSEDSGRVFDPQILTQFFTLARTLFQSLASDSLAAPDPIVQGTGTSLSPFAA
jgi:putative nucleotidyltransferase with HDIG domain